MAKSLLLMLVSLPAISALLLSPAPLATTSRRFGPLLTAARPRFGSPSAATLLRAPRRAPLATAAVAADLDDALAKADGIVVSRAVRIANHAAALTSLAYFGLVSSTMAMPAVARMPMMATLSSVLTARLGTTTNAQFADYFTTLVTPAPYVFLIWPLIAALQAVTLAASVLRPSKIGGHYVVGTGPPLAQDELAALSLANAAAAAWLFASSNAAPGALSLASALVLPLVPFFAGYPLRRTPAVARLYRPVFQVFSSFTSIAACLAFVVELQYGGRVPFFAGRAELCGGVFLSLVGALASLPRRSLARRAVTTLALSGVVARRVTSGAAAGSLLLSPTFLGAVALLAWSAKKLVSQD